MYYDIPIVWDDKVYEREEVKRSWRERFFSRPWKPLKKTKIVVRPAMYLFEAPLALPYATMRTRTIVAHPAFRAKLEEATKIVGFYDT